MTVTAANSVMSIGQSTQSQNFRSLAVLTCPVYGTRLRNSKVVRRTRTGRRAHAAATLVHANECRRPFEVDAIQTTLLHVHDPQNVSPLTIGRLAAPPKPAELLDTVCSRMRGAKRFDRLLR